MIVPYVVVRANNIALNALDEITQSQKIESICRDLQSRHRHLGEMREAVCDALYHRARDDSERYKRIIELKRRVHNGDRPDALQRRFGDLLNEFVELADWIRVSESVASDELALQHHYEDALTSARARARELAAEPV